MEKAMTIEEIEGRWHLHQALTRCSSTKVDVIRASDNTIIGFQCGCGFTYKNGETGQKATS